MVYNSYDSSGRVTSETNNSGCSSCGGGTPGTYAFTYGSSGYSGTDTNTWVTYCRTTSPSNLKTVQYFNILNQVMFSVVQATVSSTNYLWTDHYIYNATGQVTEHRTPSACTGYQWGGGSWPVFTASGGGATINNSGTAGIVEVDDYDGNGNLLDTKIRQGTATSGATYYWKAKYVYGSSGTTTYNGSTSYRVTAMTTYAADDTSSSASDARTTTYDYAYYKTTGGWTTNSSDADVTHAVAFMRTTYPSVSTSHNGLGSSNVSYVHYRQNIDTMTPTNNFYYQDWTKNVDGRLDYTQNSRSQQLTAFSIEDVLTDGSGVVSGTYENDGATLSFYEDDGHSALTAPTDPWTSTQWKSQTGYGLNRVTSYTYDDQGRTIAITTPEGMVSQTAYMSQNQTYSSKTTTITEVTLSTSEMNSSNYSYVPVSIDVENLAGETIISAQGIPTTNTDGDLTNDWTVATTTLDSAFAGTLTYRVESNYAMTYDYTKLTSTVQWSTASNGSADKYTTNYSYYSTSDTNPGLPKDTTFPDGTITKNIYDALGRVVQVKVGTDDGSPGNMVTVSKTFFDGDTSGTLVSGGAGNVTLTQTFFGTGGSDDYASISQFDWQNRMTAAEGPDKLATVYIIPTYDSGQGADYTRTQTYYDSGANFGYGSGDLRAQSDSYEDELGQTYLSIAYDVSSGGTVGDSLSTLMWYDATGRSIKTANANGLFHKTQYDSIGETVAQFTCYDSGDSSYSDAGNVTGDTVLEETVNAYDNTTYDGTTGDLLMTTSYQRIAGVSNGTKSGDLANSWASTDSRRIYVAFWYDSPMNRLAYTADYGTNGGSALTRPGSAPSTSSTVHVSHTEYDTYGRAYKTTNPNGIITEQFFNDLNMLTSTVEDYDSGDNSGAPVDTDTVKNRTTQVTYNSYGQQSALVALNPKGASIESQTTTYTYGITSPMHRNDIIASVTYPDSGSVSYTYDVMNRKTGMTDQNGTVHAYVFDSTTGLFTQDQVTTLGSGIDGTIRQIQLTYDDRDRVTKVTSYDSMSTVKNEVKYTYANSNWGQVTEIQQNDIDVVGNTGTHEIDFAYADGASGGVAKYLRLTSVNYPGPSTRRWVYYNYPSSGDGSVLSRLDNIASATSGGTTYASYTYLGAGAIAAVAHPAVTNNLILSYDPSANGSFSNLDQFSQVTDQNWTVNSSTVDEYLYGYDYDGNRNYRKNTQSTAKSEFYTYDALDRVTDRQQGTLNGYNTGISGTPAWEQAYTMDELGNWTGYVSTQSGTTFQSQTRAHNAVNETGTITHVTGSTTWVSPTYDAAGNMVSGPQPGSEATNLKFIYDGWNRLVTVENNSSVIIVTYRYDGQGHRIRKLLGSAPATPTSYYDYYYNENWQVLEEDLGGSANPYAQYIWDPRYIDAPVVRFRDYNTDGTIDDTLYYCEDANMNVTALVDTSGTVQERYTYDGYGQVHIFDGGWTGIGTSAYDNQILFGGYRYDPESGLYHVRNRMYQPTLGAWLSRDPLEYADGSNPYLALLANPVRHRDPQGTKITSSCDISSYIDDYLLSYAFSRPHGTFVYEDATKTLKKDMLRSEIIIGMMNDDYDFKIDGTDEADSIKNMRAQVDARVNVVQKATGAQFSLVSNVGGDVYSPGIDDPTSDKIYGQINTKETRITCFYAVQTILDAARGSSTIRHRNSTIYIPGDTTAISNKEFDKAPGEWDYLYASENVIYLGGDKWWGLRSEGNRNKEIMSATEWIKEIGTWPSLNGRTHAIPEMRKEVRFPANGLN